MSLNILFLNCQIWYNLALVYQNNCDKRPLTVLLTDLGAFFGK